MQDKLGRYAMTGQKTEVRKVIRMQKKRLTCKDCKKYKHCMESGRMERCQSFKIRRSSRKRDSPTTFKCVLIALALDGFLWLGILM